MAEFDIPVESKAAAMELLHLNASLAAAQAIDKLAEATGTRDVQGAVREVAEATLRVEDAIRELGQRQQNASEHLERIAKSADGIEVAARSAGRTGRDNITALFAAAVDVSGDIVDRTLPGIWINSARFGSLAAIVKFAEKKSPEDQRNKFIDRMLKAAEQFDRGLPTQMTAEEIGRFYDLVPSTWAAIQAAADLTATNTQGNPPPA
jgi:hypothetical protein